MAIDKENGAADNNGDGGDGGGGLMALMRRELDSFTTLTQEQQESACKRGYYIDDEQVQPRNNTEVKLSTMPVGDTWSLWISRSKSGAAHQNFLVSMVRFGEFHNRQSMELLLNELPDLLPLDDHTSYYMIRGRDGKPEWESEQHYLGGELTNDEIRFFLGKIAIILRIRRRKWFLLLEWRFFANWQPISAAALIFETNLFVFDERNREIEGVVDERNRCFFTGKW